MSKRIAPEGVEIKKGRPRKEVVEAKKPGNRGVVGRPPGDAARINEYKARLLAAPTANRIIDKLIQIANNDEHPGQMAALKMAVDRILPASVFEKDKEGNRPSINIVISGMESPTVSAYSDENTIDMEAEE